MSEAAPLGQDFAWSLPRTEARGLNAGAPLGRGSDRLRSMSSRSREAERELMAPDPEADPAFALRR